MPGLAGEMESSTGGITHDSPVLSPPNAIAIPSGLTETTVPCIWICSSNCPSWSRYVTPIRMYYANIGITKRLIKIGRCALTNPFIRHSYNV